MMTSRVEVKVEATAVAVSSKEVMMISKKEVMAEVVNNKAGMTTSKVATVAASSGTMSIGIMAVAREVMTINRAATVEEASKGAMTTNKAVAMVEEASKEATMIDSKANMVAARGVTTRVMITNRAATVEEASREATTINSRMDMVAASSDTTVAATSRKEETMAEEEDMVERMMI
jgi:hypothetical protein